jgi:outer membrane protein OmpA-like peptidoglycan-associated protein
MRKHLPVIAGLIGALVALSSTAKADNSFSLHLEPGLVQPLTEPQSNLYQTGGVLTVKPLFALTPNLSIGPSVAGMYLPRQIDDGQNAGTVWQFSGTARLQTDRRATNPSLTFRNISPWIDVDLGAGVTGNLWRPAVDIGIGAEVPLDQNHIAWIGPFLRYTHMFQTSDVQDGTLLDPHDVNFLQAGISISFDTPTHRKVERIETERFVVRHDAASCPPPPVSTVAVTLPEKLEISEKVYFDHDSANLRWESRDKLDAIVKVLNDHPKLVIKVEGHASSDGQKLHNVQLSGERTAAVTMYLVKHGISPARLNGVAVGIDRPSVPNTSKEGRERNRRVEFIVNFTSVDSIK